MKTIPLTKGLFATVDEAEYDAPDYKDYGTAEGRLTAIQEQGTLQLLLKDEWLKQTVRCYVPEEQLPDAFANFRRRVEVSGVIHYRRNGTPISVEVEAIEPLPDDDELPSSNDVRGLMKAKPEPATPAKTSKPE